MSEKPINKFEKAQHDRRKMFIEQNEDVADSVVSEAFNEVEGKDNDINTSNSLGDILNKPKQVKTRSTVYINADADDFYRRLAIATGLSKSGIMSKVLEIAINNDPDIQELAKQNKKVQRILKDFNEGLY